MRGGTRKKEPMRISTRYPYSRGYCREMYQRGITTIPVTDKIPPRKSKVRTSARKNFPYPKRHFLKRESRLVGRAG